MRADKKSTYFDAVTKYLRKCQLHTHPIPTSSFKDIIVAKRIDEELFITKRIWA